MVSQIPKFQIPYFQGRKTLLHFGDLLAKRYGIKSVSTFGEKCIKIHIDRVVSVVDFEKNWFVLESHNYLADL